jgi:hypothetical protein
MAEPIRDRRGRPLGSTEMDATRPRRTRDPKRRQWYARFRQVRFSAHMGFLETRVELTRQVERMASGRGLGGRSVEPQFALG